MIRWMRAACLSCLVALLVVVPSAQAAGSGFEFQGKVVYVDDGDTVVILTVKNDQVKTRLSSIDAPESSHTKHERGRIGQPYADKARRYLDDLVKGRQVVARCFEKDRYQRSVCEILVDGRSVNRDLVRDGFAWANTASHGRYLHDRELVTLQEQARAKRVGLWAGQQPVPPWEWRKDCWQQAVCKGVD